MPLIFAYTPLVGGDFWQVIQIGFSVFLAFMRLRRLSSATRRGLSPFWLYPVLIAGGAASFWPLEFLINLTGAALVTSAIVITAKKGRSRNKSAR